MKSVRSIALADLPLLAVSPIPARLRTSGRVVLVLLVLSSLVLLFAPWQQVVTGGGRVVAYSPTEREQEFHAPISGRVVRWHVVEGSRVEEGDPIVELVDVDPQYEQRLESRRAAEQQRIDASLGQASGLGVQAEAYGRSQELEMTAARLKVKMATQKLVAAEQKRDAAAAEERTARMNLERIDQLYRGGLVSKRDLELAQLHVAQTEAAKNLADAATSEAQASRTALEAEVLKAQAEGGAKVAKAQADQQKAEAEAAYARGDLAKVEVELSRQQARAVRAPMRGTIVHIDGNQGGGIVKEGQPLAILVPDTQSRAVELFIDGNDAPLVAAGRRVRLQFEGWPAVQFVGWPSVAVGTFGGRVSFVDPAATDAQGRIRALVVPDPDDQPWPRAAVLRQQVRATGWILLDQVTVGWELWRRINGFPPSLSQESGGKGAASARPGWSMESRPGAQKEGGK